MKSRPAVSITSANESHEADLNSRTRKYLILMAIRMVCFIGAFFAHGLLRWILVGGAVVLPWIAVLIANAVAARFQTSPSDDYAPPPEPLGESDGDEDSDGPIIIEGELAEDDDD